MNFEYVIGLLITITFRISEMFKDNWVVFRWSESVFRQLGQSSFSQGVFSDSKEVVLGRS